MKRLFLMLNFLLIAICNFGHEKKSALIGKWQLIETNSSDGERYFCTPIKNGGIIIFEKRNVMIDSLGNKGRYEVHGNRLKISLLNDEFYHWGFSDDKPDKLYLSPRTSKFEIICDEGCSDVYQKI